MGTVIPVETGWMRLAQDTLHKWKKHLGCILAEKICMARIYGFHAVGSDPGYHAWQTPYGSFFLYAPGVGYDECRSFQHGEKMLAFHGRYQNQIGRWELIAGSRLDGSPDLWIRVDRPVHVHRGPACYAIATANDLF